MREAEVGHFAASAVDGGIWQHINPRVSDWPVVAADIFFGAFGAVGRKSDNGTSSRFSGY
jgi:hypothetical protein